MESKKKIIFVIVCIIIVIFSIDLRNDEEASAIYSDNAKRREMSDDLNYKGLTLIDEGKIEEGIDYFQQALQVAEEYKEEGDSPDLEKGNLLSDAYNNLGYAYYLLDQYDQSKDYLDKALAIEPNDATEHSNMGNTYIALGQNEAAMNQFDLSLEYDSKLSYALYGKGTVYYDQEEYDKALPFFNLYLEQLPEDIDAISYAIYCNLYLDNFDKALKLADEAIQTFEDDYDFYLAKGDIYARTKNYEELNKFYMDLANNFDHDVNAQIELGEFYYNSEEYQAAFNQFSKTKTQFPDNLDLDSWIISCYASQDDFEGLNDYYHEQVAASKETDQLCIDIGYAYYNSNYYMESIPYFERAIKINPESEDTYLNILQSLFYGKRYKKGIEFGLEAEQKFSTNYDIPYYIGDCYYALGDYDNAIIAYKRALELSPDNVDLLAFIGESYLYLNDLQNAKTYSEEALKKDSMNQSALNTRSLLKDRNRELSLQIKEFIKENYLYYDEATMSDKSMNQLLTEDAMSNFDIAVAVDKLKKTEDIFTYSLFDQYYDEYSMDDPNDVEYDEYGDISYLRIYGFNQYTDSKVIEILDSIKDPENKILAIDLRENGGGLMQGATNILDVLLGECVTCTLVYRDGNTYNYYSDASQIKFKEVYLFVDEYTASASEVLTLGLKTYLKNVTVLGQNTYGKGVGQITYEDKDRKLVLYLVNFYWNVRQQNLMGSYIEPDIYINSDKLEDYIDAID